jgi:hypothetical protein
MIDGPWAMLPVGFVHLCLAGIGQSIVSGIRNWRITVALDRKPIQETNQKWNANAFQKDSTSLYHREETKLDPAKYLIDSLRSFLWNALFPDPPSYIRHATDIEYRKKLQLKLSILNQQIYELQNECKSKNIEF